MDPSVLIPPADAIPSSPWLIWGLLDVTFTVHLLLMNTMMGLSFVGLWRSMRQPYALGHIAGLVPNFVALTVNVGVAPLLFVQLLYGQFLYVSSALMGVYWFSVVLVVMAAYALSYRQKYALHRGAGPGTPIWALLCLLFLYVSLVQTHNAVLLLRPQLWSGYLDNPSGTMTAWADPTVIARWLHFVTASAAMGGLALAMIGHRHAKSHDPQGPVMRKQGLAWLGYATLAQVAIGMWWLMTLPRPLLLAFMGGDALATGLLLAGVTLAMGILGFAFKGKLMPAAGCLVATTMLMVVMRDVLRRLYLLPYFDPELLPVRAEPGTVAMFYGCLILSLAVVWWASAMPTKDTSKPVS